jgi:hypothetical protein
VDSSYKQTDVRKKAGQPFALGAANAKALVSANYPQEQLPSAHQRTGDRTGISAAITFV